MVVTFYELVGEGQNNFSPWCWPVRMALWHKKIDFETVPLKFTQISSIDQGQYKTLPLIKHNMQYVVDSVAIALHLDAHFLEKDALFSSEKEKNYAVFVKNFCASCLTNNISRLIVYDVYQTLYDDDKPYFRQSREKYFGQPLEDVQSQYRQLNLLEEVLHKNLRPLTMTLKQQDYLGGMKPSFLDYQIYGVLKWADMCSDYIIPSLDQRLTQWYRLIDNYYSHKV